MFTAIIGILLGNFLIATLFAPSLKRLRDVLDKLTQIRLPFESVWALLGDQPDEAALLRARNAATSAFNLYFREYSMAFSAFKRLGYVFLSAVVVLGCAAAWQTAFPTKVRLALMATSTG